MHLKTEDLTRLEIEFDSGVLPPPFSHVFKLKITFEKNFINTHFDLKYSDRESLTEEEVFEEGFTMNDDYSFIGEIPKVWEKPLKELYSKSKWSNKKLEQDGGTKLMAKDTHGKILRHIPLNQEDWQYLAQQYIQAIYEISRKENPLTIRLYSNTAEGIHDYAVTVKFALRKIEAEVNGERVEADWDKTQSLLSHVYLAEYDYSIAKEKKPTKRGVYIDSGDGLWHEFGQGVVNIDPSYDALQKIRQEFVKLNQP